MVPISMSMRLRRCSLSVRTISLTPPGVSTNLILDHILDDIVNSATKNVNGVNVDGEACLVFIDVVGYGADYPARSADINSMWQSLYPMHSVHISSFGWP